MANFLGSFLQGLQKPLQQGLELYKQKEDIEDVGEMALNTAQSLYKQQEAASKIADSVESSVKKRVMKNQSFIEDGELNDEGQKRYNELLKENDNYLEAINSEQSANVKLTQLEMSPLSNLFLNKKEDGGYTLKEDMPDNYRQLQTSLKLWETTFPSTDDKGADYDIKSSTYKYYDPKTNKWYKKKVRDYIQGTKTVKSETVYNVAVDNQGDLTKRVDDQLSDVMDTAYKRFRDDKKDTYTFFKDQFNIGSDPVNTIVRIRLTNPDASKEQLQELYTDALKGRTDKTTIKNNIEDIYSKIDELTRNYKQYVKDVADQREGSLMPTVKRSIADYLIGKKTFFDKKLQEEGIDLGKDTNIPTAK